MNRKALEIAVRQALLTSLPSWWTLPIVAGMQPAGQGRVDGIYFWRIGDGKLGWIARGYDKPAASGEVTERQWSETQYQFSALITDDINDPSQLLAGDALSVVRMTLAGVNVANSLMSQGIGIQRPSGILSPTFINDRGQYEYHPNFSIVLSHHRDLKHDVPDIDSFHVDVERV